MKKEIESKGDFIGNGRIKEYYEDGTIKFEGECKNFKKWNGKKYDNKGKIIYEIKKEKNQNIKKRPLKIKKIQI